VRSSVFRQLPGRPRADYAAGTAPDLGSHETNPMVAAIETSRHRRFRYCDYYSFMSLADFLAWVEKNDGSEPDISHTDGR
jgi:hypothetical protein